MNEPFNLTVNYQGNDQVFKARFERWGYTHCMAVLIDETTVNFKPDEEGGYRALSENPEAGKALPTGLLAAVAEKLAALHNG